MSFVAMVVGLLLILSGLACLAGWVWLVGRAFKKSVGWGLAMLFAAPVAAIVAAIDDWQGWKRPFLIYWGSAALQVFILIVALVALPFALPFSLASNPETESEPAPESAPQAETTAPPEEVPVPAVEAAGASQSEEPAANPASAPPAQVEAAALIDPAGQPAAASVTNPARASHDRLATPSGMEVAAGFEEINVSSAAKHAGSKVRIFDREGRLHSGVLKGVENGALVVAFDLGAGSVITDFEPKEILSLQVVAAN